MECSAKVKGECSANKYFENILFFLQEEIEDIEGTLGVNDFRLYERKPINKVIDKMVDDLNLIKSGQQVIYEDLKEELEELKDYYFLNKKNWSQLLGGKLLEMVASGMISEAVSKKLLNIIKENYSELVS